MKKPNGKIAATRLLQYREPVVIMTAVQIAKLPLEKMREQIDAQEKIHQKEQTIGGHARIILRRLRAGEQITQQIYKSATSRFFFGTELINNKAVRQLIARGYLLP